MNLTRAEGLKTERRHTTMLSLKEFEKSMKSVAQEEIDQKRTKGQYISYVEVLVQKAKVLPVGQSIEVDVKEKQKAVALAGAIRVYLKRGKMDQFVVGSFKSSVFCGKRAVDGNGGN